MFLSIRAKTLVAIVPLVFVTMMALSWVSYYYAFLKNVIPFKL